MYKQRTGYDYKLYQTEYNGYSKEEFQEKVTEPGLAITIKQLVERYEKGQRARRIPADV